MSGGALHLLGGYGLPAPLGKLCVCALDVVAARNMVAGTQAVIDAGGGVIVGLGHAALFHNGVGQRDGRQQAPGVGVDGMLKDLLGGAGLQQVAQMEHPDAVRDILDHGKVMGDEEVGRAGLLLDIFIRLTTCA